MKINRERYKNSVKTSQTQTLHQTPPTEELLEKKTLPPEFSGQWSCSMQPRTTGTVEDELANWPMMCSQLRKRMAGCKVEEFHEGMPDYIHFRIAPHSTKSCLEPKLDQQILKIPQIIQFCVPLSFWGPHK